MRVLLCAVLLVASAGAGKAAPQIDDDEYHRKIQEVREQQTKDVFTGKLKDEHKMSTKAADRTWKYFQEQLDHHRVQFTEDGFRYALPNSHLFADYLPHALVEAIEAALKGVRLYVWYPIVKTLPREYQHLHVDGIEFLHDNNISHALLGLCAFYIGLKFIGWVVFRFTYEAPAETKRMAALYDELKEKKQI